MTRKRQIILTNRDRFLGSLWCLMNTSMSNAEVIEVMNIIGETNGRRAWEIYSRSKTKGQREQAIKDIKCFLKGKLA